MKRLVWRLLNAPLLFLILALSVSLVTSLFNSYPLHYFQPDLIFILVIWCALRRTFTEGGVLTLLFALLAENHSSCPQGYYMSMYMALYLLMRLFSRFFVISQFSALLSVTMGGMAFFKFIHLFFLSLFGLADRQFGHVALMILPNVAMAGLVGSFAYRYLEIFDRVTYKSERSRQLIEDELLVEEGI